jgi:xylulokinase
MLILGFDVGTSSIKAAILDTATAEPAGPLAHVGYDLDYPTPEAAEMPAERLWQALTEAGRRALAQDQTLASGVQGVGLSTLTPALVLLDRADQPLTPIWTHLDRRSRPVAQRVWDDVGQEFLHTVGNRPLPGGISVLCFRQQVEAQPDLLHRVHSYLHLNGWLALNLTGAKAFDPGNASFTGLFGTVTDQRWSPRWCQYFEVDPDWLPPVVSGDTTIGQLRSEVAADLGLSAGLPVKLGVPDTSSAMLSMDMTDTDLLHVVGTTQVLSCYTTNPQPSEQRLTRHLGCGDRFVYVAHNPVGGVALEWLHQLCFHEQTADEFFQDTIRQAHHHSTRVVLDPPFLGGDRLQIEPHRAAFRELTLTSERLDLLAALLNALVEHHREALKTLDMGNRIERILLTGGGADVVHRIIPEYSQANIVEFTEGSLKGVARLFAEVKS